MIGPEAIESLFMRSRLGRYSICEGLLETFFEEEALVFSLFIPPTRFTIDLNLDPRLELVKLGSCE